MPKKKPRLQFRYYEMCANEQVLALLGESWRRPYGEGISDLHFHNYMEIGICYEGYGKSTLRDNVNIFRGGVISIIPPNYPHHNETEPGETAFWEWMYFDMDSVLQDMKNLSCSKLDTESITGALNGSALFFQQDEHRKISSTILEIRDECDKRAYMYREKLRGLLQSFTVELLRIHNVQEELPRKSPRNFQIAPALAYAKDHYHEEIRVRDLARACNMSESHFRRIFRECMNMPPNDLINVVRIREAGKLLLKSHISMEEVAYRVGYTNVSTFNRNFKRMMGITPYQWKKSPDNYAGRMLDFRISTLKGW